MKSIRRLTSTIVSSFDWMISQVENHESLVGSAIREIQEAGARAKVQHKRVKQDGQEMRKRLQDLRREEDLWNDRAIKTAAVDEKKAVECLKRRKRIQKDIETLEEQERAHAQLEKQLGEDLKLVEDRIVTLKRQRNVLRTRQSRAEALRTLQHEDSSLISEIDNILDRWEVKVSEYEIQGCCSASGRDDFEEEYVSAEEESTLKEELAALVDSTSKPNDAVGQ